MFVSFVLIFVLIFSYILHSVILLGHGGVDLVGLRPNPYDFNIFFQCFDTVCWVI